MVTTDPAQVTDLVRIYILFIFSSNFIEPTGGLYRDDALLTVGNVSSRKLELYKKVYIFFKG